MRELEDIADDVRDEFLLIPEVAKVEIYGVQEERMFVEYNNARLAELGLSPMQLSAAPRRARTSSSQVGTYARNTKRSSSSRSGNFESVEELRGTVIRLPGRDDLDVSRATSPNVRREATSIRRQTEDARQRRRARWRSP